MCEQNTHTDFLNLEEEKKYTDAKKESFSRFNLLIDSKFPDLRKFEIQINIENYLELVNVYNRQSIEKILSEINDKPNYHQKHKNLFKTFQLFVERSSDLKSKISKQQGIVRSTGQLSPDEERGRQILRSVLGDSYNSG